MQHPRYVISAAVPAEVGQNIDRIAAALGITRNRFLGLCIQKAIPLLVADAANRLADVQQATGTQRVGDLPQSAK